MNDRSLVEELAFTTTIEQQRALGLPEIPSTYMPHEFMYLVGRGLLVHDRFAEDAQSVDRCAQVNYKANAGVAQSVVVGVLNKVVELGEIYDSAATPKSPEAKQSMAREGVARTNFYDGQYSPLLLAHYTMAAARRIAEVRQLQRQQTMYDALARS